MAFPKIEANACTHLHLNFGPSSVILTGSETEIMVRVMDYARQEVCERPLHYHEEQALMELLLRRVLRDQGVRDVSF